MDRWSVVAMVLLLAAAGTASSSGVSYSDPDQDVWMDAEDGRAGAPLLAASDLTAISFEFNAEALSAVLSLRGGTATPLYEVTYLVAFQGDARQYDVYVSVRDGIVTRAQVVVAEGDRMQTMTVGATVGDAWVGIEVDSQDLPETLTNLHVASYVQPCAVSCVVGGTSAISDRAPDQGYFSELTRGSP